MYAPHTALSRLTDTELLRHVESTVDPLTSTDLELTLAVRFQKLIDDYAAFQPWEELSEQFQVTTRDIDRLLESHPGSPDEMRGLLSILNDHDIHKPDQLKELIEFAQKFNAIAQDAGDVFDRLQSLISKAQE